MLYTLRKVEVVHVEGMWRLCTSQLQQRLLAGLPATGAKGARRLRLATHRERVRAGLATSAPARWVHSPRERARHGAEA